MSSHVRCDVTFQTTNRWPAYILLRHWSVYRLWRS